MNNRVQQCFDRSIREAVQETERLAEEQRAFVLTKRQERARRLLPKLEARLKAHPTDVQRDVLMRLRSDYRRILGLTLDRKGEEL